MQALRLEAASGLRWIVGGWRMFRRQPFGFLMLWFFFSLLLLCANEVIGVIAQGIASALPGFSADVIATIGSLLFATVIPALTVGFLQSCRAADSNLPIHPVLLFAPLRAGRKTIGRLLALGAIQVVAVMLLLFMLGGSDAFRSDPPTPAGSATGNEPAAARSASSRSSRAGAGSRGAPAVDGSGSAASAATTNPAGRTNGEANGTATDAGSPGPDNATVELSPEDMQRATLLSELALAYLPVTLLMWFAPMLVAWHDVPVGKALFFNLVGVWRNRAAFLVYGVAWLVIGMTLSMLIGIVGIIVGVGSAAMILVTPLAMVLLTCMYCSMYQTYATVYVDEARPATVIP